MRKLTAFYSTSLDGYFTGENGDLSWAHSASANDREYGDFVANNSKGGGMLLMGRTTYEMMIQYWPTPAAKKNDPVVAENMNKMPKIVFSKTMKKADWSNTTVVSDNIADAVRKLKKESGDHITILGSGTIVTQLTDEGLIDEYGAVVVPVVLGKGRTLFNGIKKKLDLTLTNSRIFSNGFAYLSYERKG